MKTSKPKKPATELLPWQIEDAARLRAFFENREPKISQMKFGGMYEIGSQGMVWQYVNGHRPLNFKAAAAFARGLNVKIEDFSPTLAREISNVANTSIDHIVPTNILSNANLSDVAQLIAIYGQLNVDERKYVLDFARDRLRNKSVDAIVTPAQNNR